MTARTDEVLSLLDSAEQPLTASDVAALLGLHPNTARVHLEALVDMGRAERRLGHSGGPGRPPVLYTARRSLDRGPRHYRLLASMLADGVAASRSPRRTALGVGRRWGAALVTTSAGSTSDKGNRPVDRMLDMLDALDFAPDRTTPVGAEIRLRGCPFLELARERTDVVCSLHLGLMQGALDALDTPLSVTSLDPLVEPDLCVARLAKTSAAS